MSASELKFRWSTLWLLAATAISAIEFVAAANRTHSTKASARNADERTLIASVDNLVDSRVISVHDNAILVLGNLGPISEGDVEIVLSAHQAGSRVPDDVLPVRRGSTDSTETHRDRRGLETPPDPAETHDQRSAPLLKPDSNDSRVYFLQSDIRATGNPAVHSAITCRLVAQNNRLRIYLDTRLQPVDDQAELIRSIDIAAAAELGENVEKLVGRVHDIDHDGHLTVVITPEVARLGTGQTPVDGLTRPADFLSGLERPFGNNSDVIFLSSHLEPGDHLRAVLAHEWCHAAIFSRRDPGSQPLSFDEDWINEAIAHVVERRASGSETNLSHRIQSFLAKPESCPLVVGDYYHPEYWRHDGCRGAAFLFLDWCLRQQDDLLTRLVDSPSLNQQSLEAATGRSFPDLFRGWTTELGRKLASQQSNLCIATGVKNECPSSAEWELGTSSSASHPQLISVRLRGTCARFIRVRCPPGTTWNLTAFCRANARIQTTLIPVSKTVSRGDVH